MDINNLLCGLIGAIITLIGTVIAMLSIDKNNKKRWMNDGYLKRKVELEIEIRQVLFNIKRELNSLPQLKEFKKIKTNLNKQNLKQLNEINKNFSQIKSNIKESQRKSIPNSMISFRIETGNLNEGYSLDPLLDEYLIFTRDKDALESLKKRYKIFLKTETLETKVKANSLGEKSAVGISETDLEDKTNEIKIVIDCVYEFKKQLEEVLKIIEANFELNKKCWWQIGR